MGGRDSLEAPRPARAGGTVIVIESSDEEGEGLLDDRTRHTALSEAAGIDSSEGERQYPKREKKRHGNVTTGSASSLRASPKRLLERNGGEDNDSCAGFSPKRARTLLEPPGLPTPAPTPTSTATPTKRPHSTAATTTPLRSSAVSAPSTSLLLRPSPDKRHKASRKAAASEEPVATTQQRNQNGNNPAIGKMCKGPCGKWRPFADFEKETYSVCRPCNRKRRQEADAATPEIFFGKMVSNAQRSHESRLKEVVEEVNRALLNGLAFDMDALHEMEQGFTIDTEYLLSLYNEQKHVCALSGRQLVLQWSTEDNFIEDQASPDRLDNTRTYTRGNVQLVAQIGNQFRQRLAVPDFIELCRSIEAWTAGGRERFEAEMPELDV